MRGIWQGKGRPVVLLHGQPGSSNDWSGVMAELTGLRMIAPARPGYDGSTAVSFVDNANRLSGLLGSSEVDRAVIVGHSWGGGVALQLALDHPRQVAGLCLLGSVGSQLAVTRQDRLLAVRGVASVATAATIVTAVLAPRLFVAATGSRLPAAGLRRLRSQGIRWWREGALHAAAAEQRFLVQHADRLAERLTEVEALSLVVTGRNDRTVSPAAAADLAQRLPRGELRTVPGGHLLPQESPGPVSDAIRWVVEAAEW